VRSFPLLFRHVHSGPARAQSHDPDRGASRPPPRSAAARPQYTFFDQCVLESLPTVQNFVALADKAKECVAVREKRKA